MGLISDNTKEDVKFISSVLLLIAGVVIVFISLYLPPIGVVDSSILTLIGENFCFVGAVWGIGQYAKVQIERIKSTGRYEIEGTGNKDNTNERNR